jgi:hypothetical protein
VGRGATGKSSERRGRSCADRVIVSTLAAPGRHPGAEPALDPADVDFSSGTSATTDGTGKMMVQRVPCSEVNVAVPRAWSTRRRTSPRP